MSKVLGTSMSFIITIFQNKDKLSRNGNQTNKLCRFTN
jgi:hypothetical protein